MDKFTSQKDSSARKYPSAFSAKAILLPVNDVDTDQIIPARFLKTTNKAGLGEQLFADWRYNSDGSLRPGFPLNNPELRVSQILVAGDNFGCGSSREHAPWALVDYGFRAVVATSFADIFRNNSLKNGLLPVVIDVDTHSALVQSLSQNPMARLTIDLEKQLLSLPDGSSVQFPINSFARTCLLNGVDELGYLLSFEAQISIYESRHAK
jgi:3-isopropylmalate/(R)-2-methylmalate dehydratase small subunit